MLTNSQLAIVKADIISDSALNAFPNTSDGNYAIAAIYNEMAAPDWIVWKDYVTSDEVMLNGFDWTRVDNLSVGKARSWDWMFRPGYINPSKVNIRAGIDAVWVGTQADLNVRAAVYVHCKRLATRFEKLLSTGTGSDAVPATASFYGQTNYNDIGEARSS